MSLKFRISRNASKGILDRGMVQMDIECNDEEVLDQLTESLRNLGFSWSHCQDECDYGFVTEFFVSSEEVDHFRAVYLSNKKNIMAHSC